MKMTIKRPGKEIVTMTCTSEPVILDEALFADENWQKTLAAADALRKCMRDARLANREHALRA
jgi:hypothetical protein